MAFRVSTSEVNTFLTCKQRWMYAHHPSYNLEPRTLGIALTRGIVGHKALELYYEMISHNEPHADAVDVVQEYIMGQFHKEVAYGDGEKSIMLMELLALLKNYLEESRWLLDRYDILGVEHLVTAPLPGVEDIDFAGRIDVVFGIKSRNEAIPFDHKLCYNFWSDNSLRMNPQLSNYAWALSQIGYNSNKGIMNMVRYRENAIDKFKQEEVSVKPTVQGMFIQNHTVAAIDIVELKKKPEIGIQNGVTRSASKFNCEYCPFNELCYTESQGGNSKNVIAAHYRPNSYGYVDSELDIS